MTQTGEAGGGLSTLTGPVEIVGVGLLGTSVALACASAGLDVLLSDSVASHVRTATGLGAGRRRRPGDTPQLVVVAVPPAHLGEVITRALADSPDAVVTDVGSVKASPLTYVREHGPGDVRRYVGGHPMAGSERSGPLAATSTLFEGRPWNHLGSGLSVPLMFQLWPISVEPTSWPSTSTIEPLALSWKATCPMPVTTSG